MKYAIAYEIAIAMKYAAAYGEFILFHIFATAKIFHNLQKLFHIA